MTDDGQYLAGTIRSRRGRLGNDHSRYGDPNYVGPNLSDFVLINSQTGETTKIISSPSSVGRFSFSPDGSNLAFIIYDGTFFNLYTYNLKSNRSKQVKLKTSLRIASNSNIEWMPEGTAVVLSFRPEGWAEKADSMFREATAGPITVYDSKRPFLKWDELGNWSDIACLMHVKLSDGSCGELLPGGSLGKLHEWRSWCWKCK